MPRRMYVAILLLLLTACPTPYGVYRPFPPKYPLIKNGGRLKIDSGYSEFFQYYDVTASYVRNGRIKPYYYKWTAPDGQSRYDWMKFYLVKGQHTILIVEGTNKWSSEPFNWHSLLFPPPRNGFLFICAFESITMNDTLFLRDDDASCILCFDVRYDRHVCFRVLEWTGYTQELNGYLLFNSIAGDTLAGVAHFTGHTDGKYLAYDLDGQHIEDTQSGSWVICSFAFRATSRRTEEDSTIVGAIEMGRHSED